MSPINELESSTEAKARAVQLLGALLLKKWQGVQSDQSLPANSLKKAEAFWIYTDMTARALTQVIHALKQDDLTLAINRTRTLLGRSATWAGPGGGETARINKFMLELESLARRQAGTEGR